MSQTLVLKGASGREYAFTVYPWGTEFKPVGGVYAATTCSSPSGAGTHQVKYIGQTGDLSERFDSHHKADCFRKNGVNCLSVRPESSEQTRLAIEADLVQNYSPPCNG